MAEGRPAVTLAELASAALLIAGAAFFLAGTIGLLRFPDVYTRLHALTKADNLGLGFVAAGLAIDASSLAAALELGLVWALILLSSSMASRLVAGEAWRAGAEPWRRP
ncbi:MAG TPA: monovalent cation/H(+) antiporter subunit G [Kofleriaceae bacterium]|nr:monovalent cation/H(+) antiporter subunit G [Kofleriaceae bacterium]